MNDYIKENRYKTINQLIAGMMLGRFLAEDLEDEKLRPAIWFWLKNL